MGRVLDGGRRVRVVGHLADRLAGVVGLGIECPVPGILHLPQFAADTVGSRSVAGPYGLTQPRTKFGHACFEFFG